MRNLMASRTWEHGKGRYHLVGAPTVHAVRLDKPYHHPLCASPCTLNLCDNDPVPAETVPPADRCSRCAKLGWPDAEPSPDDAYALGVDRAYALGVEDGAAVWRPVTWRLNDQDERTWPDDGEAVLVSEDGTKPWRVAHFHRTGTGEFYWTDEHDAGQSKGGYRDAWRRLDAPPGPYGGDDR